MPDGVADTRRVALVCWSGTRLALLDGLTIEIREIPKVGHWLVHTTHKVILDLTLVMHAIEVNFALVSEGVPESPLRRRKSF